MAFQKRRILILPVIKIRSGNSSINHRVLPVLKYGAGGQQAIVGCDAGGQQAVVGCRAGGSRQLRGVAKE